MAKTKDAAFDPGAFWTEKHFADQASQGSDIRDNPAVALPSLPNWANAQPESRDTIMSALLGIGPAVSAGNDAAKFGSPLAAALSAIAGGMGAPSPQAVAQDRQARDAQARLAALSSLPVEAMSPALVAAHPELKGIPLAVVNQIAPLIERASAMQDQHYNLDQAAQILSPDKGSVAKTKAELASIFPNGNVPKDFVHVAASNNRSAMMMDANDAKAAYFRARTTEVPLKRLDAMGSDLDPSRQKQGALGVSKQVFDRAERLQTLVKAVPNGNLDSRQMEEVAIGLNAMLSGSNSGAQEQVKSLVPKTAIGDAQKLREWLFNDPQGTKQQAFIQRMMESVSREKATAEEQIKRVQMQRAASKYSDLEQTNPEAFYTKLQSFGIQPEEYQAWKNSGFKQISAVQSPGSPSAGTSRFKIVAVE